MSSLPPKILFFLYLSCCTLVLDGKEIPVKNPALIPSPQHVEWTGGYFNAQGSVPFFEGIDTTAWLCREARELFAGKEGISAARKGTGKSKVVLSLLPLPVQGGHGEEYYRLKVTSGSIQLTAWHSTGLYHGLQTLRQLKKLQNGVPVFTCCTIEDWPAFSWRGFMQDVGRNYMSPAILKEQIGVMAAYKYNIFHFHLTDNNGWRLESRKSPQLKSAASMSRWPGKFYSQEEFLELARYCRDRSITLVPELDIPGHAEAFRKALGLDSMSDRRVKPILLDLLDELCSLLPPDQMPWVHLGTDEVWSQKEKPAADLLPALVSRVVSLGRKPVVWRPGQNIPGDTVSITQLWSSNGRPKDGHAYIDSRLNYLNHLDPLAGMSQLFFDPICGATSGDNLRLGGTLCCWNDNLPRQESDILRMNPVYPGMLVYAETTWKGSPEVWPEKYLARLPEPGTKASEAFLDMQERLVAHRDRYFRDKPFPYVKNASIPWRLIGPFDHKGDVKASFPVEAGLKEEYQFEGKTFRWWGPVYGGTVYVRHFFGYPVMPEVSDGTVYAMTRIFSPVKQDVGAWIGFHGWSRSGGRRGGPSPGPGEWHTTQPKAWVNGTEIPPPAWENPGLPVKSDEIPFSNEDYFYRIPATVRLNKGWNEVLLKIPYAKPSWKWMFTFVPLQIVGGKIREADKLTYSAELKTEN